jgi:hypothetical protein
MVSQDYLYVVLLIGMLYLAVQLIHWTGRHSCRH